MDQESPEMAEPGPVELEVKFRLDAALAQDILSCPLLAAAGPWAEEHLKTRYFDTQDFALRRAGFDLRVRDEGNGKLVQCLKQQVSQEMGPFGRPEYETETSSREPKLSQLPPGMAEKLKQIVGARKLQARSETDVFRRRAEIQHGTSRIEIACDKGIVSAGKRSEAISEFELELLSGRADDLLDLAIALASLFPLKLDFASKSAKGYRLASGKVPEPVKAGAVDVAPKARTEELLARLLGNGLSHFTANWEPVLRGDDPGAVHQIRVALRRLRCFFAISPDDQSIETLKQEAKTLAQLFGPARGLDVFHAYLESGPFSDRKNMPPGVRILEAVLARRRSEARAKARQALEGSAATLLVLHLQRRIVGFHDLIGSGPSARSFARRALNRFEKRALKRGRSMPDLDGEQLHELRIALKYLRYASEAFGALTVGEKQRRKLISSTATLQDLLGQWNDGRQFGPLLLDLAAEAGKKAEPAVQFVAGWLAHLRSSPIHGIEKAWSEFLKSRPELG